jgi:TPR repeat protein
MKKFAKNGSPLAQATISLMYADGIGTNTDQDLSFKYIRKAANNGIAFAEYMLGMLYRKSQLIDKYGKDADYWLMRAANGNYKPAIYLMLSESEFTHSGVNNSQQAARASITDEDMEVIMVNADKYTLTDFYDLMKKSGLW